MNVPEYDVIVCGGGISGVAAALAASEEGMKTLLIEKTALWGGLATSGMIYIYLPLCDGMGHQVSRGLAEKLFHASYQYGPGAENPDWNTPNPHADPAHSRYRTSFVPAAFILAMDELLEKAGVELLLDTLITGTETENGNVTGVRIFNKGGESLIHASVIIDATGDADIVRFSGGRFVTEGNMLSFWGLQIARNGAAGKSLFPGDLHDVRCGVIDPAPVRQALTLRGTSDFLLDSRRWLREYYGKKYAEGADRTTLFPVTLPTQAQFRKTAHIISRQGLADKMHNLPVSDPVGMAADWCNAGIVQEIPWSAMLPKKNGNIIVCGRCIDASGYSWELTRSIPAVAVSGEAAGRAAALCVREKCSPHQLCYDKLSALLRKRGQVLSLNELGIPYRDPSLPDALTESFH